MRTWLCFLLLSFLPKIWSSQVRYDGYQVHRITPKNEKALEALQALEQNVFDFWSSIRGIGHPVDIMVPPDSEIRFGDSRNFDSQLWIPNVQELIDNEKSQKKVNRFALSWEDYYDLDEINAFLDEIVANHSTIVQPVIAGTSYEGRTIRGVKISYSPANLNRTVFLESNIHAREWITSAVSTWILNQILTSENPDVRRIVEGYDWYIVPVFNPDGFVYTHSVDRMWRKTRTPYFFCNGVDPNRNWDFQWNTGGSSPNPCSDIYRGPEAFSEQSTKTISDFITTISQNLLAYIDLHSYGQYLMIPYGSDQKYCENYDELYSVGLKAVETLRQRYETNYTVGNIVDLLSVASGSSMDWVKGNFNTRITYAYELRDKGEFGFVLPAEQIVPTAEETFDSLLTILDEFDKLM